MKISEPYSMLLDEKTSLPLPPFLYRAASGGVFTFSESNRVLIWGRFPIAPTGGFSEYWELTREDDGSNEIKDIVVDNYCRLRAGRLHWSMPKRFGEVGISAEESLVSLTVPGYPGGIAIQWHSTPETTTPASSSVELHLECGDYASLKFSRISTAVSACYSDATGRFRGYVRLFRGNVVLTAPRSQMTGA